MKNSWKILIGLFALALIAGLVVYFFVYNKPHVNYEKAKPELTLSGESLYLAYMQDEQAANESYTGKIIQVDGVLFAKETADTLTIALFSYSDGMFGPEGIRCTMLGSQASALLDTPDGAPLAIKGFVAGFNGTDVIMENCSIVD